MNRSGGQDITEFGLRHDRARRRLCRDRTEDQIVTRHESEHVTAIQIERVQQSLEFRGGNGEFPQDVDGRRDLRRYVVRAEARQETLEPGGAVGAE